MWVSPDSVQLFKHIYMFIGATLLNLYNSFIPNNEKWNQGSDLDYSYGYSKKYNLKIDMFGNKGESSYLS